MNDWYLIVSLFSYKPSKILRSSLLIKLKFPDTTILFYVSLSIFKTVILRTITITIYDNLFIWIGILHRSVIWHAIANAMVFNSDEYVLPMLFINI